MNKQDLKNEFMSLCNDDALFNYSENEFEEWIKDHNIEVEE